MSISLPGYIKIRRPWGRIGMGTTAMAHCQKMVLVLLLLATLSRSEDNIALNMDATQSSDYSVGIYQAENAVDGCRGSFSQSCCIHTASGHSTVWWRVDLGQLSTIKYIAIWYRTGFEKRFGGYHLYLANTTTSAQDGILCYEDKSSTLGQLQLTVSHQCPYVARYVTIYNYRNIPKRYSWYDYRAILELCEVEVYGCPAGRYGVGNCLNDCSGQCYGGNCDSNTGSCFYCFSGKYGDICENDCPFNCKDNVCDKDAGSCSACIPGKYGTSCDQDCPPNCDGSVCGFSTGFCTACIPGKYGTSCDQDCPANCDGSVCGFSAGFCTACIPGKYGTLCDQDCPPNCDGSVCGFSTGFCTACIPGKYETLCNQDCPINCDGSVCGFSTGFCTACIPGKYGTVCDTDCSTNCNRSICAFANGFCTDCIPGKYSNYCELDCSNNCGDGICAKSNGFCTYCLAGAHDDTCDKNCSTNCLDNTCDQHTANCLQCIPGKYGDNCDETCPMNCADSICNKTSGLCTGCIPGKYGDTCDTDCPTNCADSICDKTSGLCKHCIPGTYGDVCQSNCSTNCKDGLCDEDAGICFDCFPGKHSTPCTLNCPSNCKDNACGRENGVCAACEGGFYGSDCTLSCQDNCAECLQSDGNCTGDIMTGATCGAGDAHSSGTPDLAFGFCEECSGGLYGRSCSQSCGRCSLCHIDTGACVSQCFSGYEGSNCNTVSKQDAGPSSDVGTIAGAVAGAIVAIVIVVVVVIFVMRRRKLSDTRREPFPTRNKAENQFYQNVMVLSDENVEETPKEQESIYINTSEVPETPAAEESVYYNAGPIGIAIGDLKSMIKSKMKDKAKAFEEEYKSLPTGPVHADSIGQLPENKIKNRFKTTFPYDHSRVVLDTLPNEPHSDYINANYIDSVTKSAEYIATQGPRPVTIDEHWRMIWQLESGKIVMLTSLMEGTKPKCAKYWPDEGNPLSTAHFKITLDRERVCAFYTIRDITVTEKKTKSVRQVHQFHYTTWPDHGTPDPNELIAFYRRVKRYENTLPGKMVVHCSAVIGRTGTFIALDALLEYGKESGRVDIKEYVNTMRKNRVNMVQTSEQYIALHNILVEAFDMPDTLIPRAKFHSTLLKLSNGAPKLRKEFQQTQTLKPTYGPDDYHTALSPENKNKNRTMSVVAVERYRAFLRSHSSDRTDYINGVLVPSYTSRTGYIVTQSPMEETVVDLLTMIMDYSCETLVIIENDLPNWFPQENTDKTIGPFTLAQKGQSSNIANVELIEINVSSQENNYSATVRVFHMAHWDRKSSVPHDSSSLLQLLEMLDSRRKSDNTKTTVVMCRDGYSQSGLFCFISNARDQMKIDDEVDIFQISRQILMRSPGFITNLEQYQYCYDIIKDYLDTTDVYMN